MSVIPQKLKKGDKVMIIAPSRSLKLIKEDCRKIAEDRLNNLGLEVVFAPNTTDENCDLTISKGISVIINWTQFFSSTILVLERILTAPLPVL